MRIAAWAAALLLLSGCSTPATPARPPESPQAALAPIACTEPRPEVCTMEYAPVCASMAAGGFRTYASGCSACGDPMVAAYQDGPCSE